jgi:hypothetical protein
MKSNVYEHSLHMAVSVYANKNIGRNEVNYFSLDIGRESSFIEIMIVEWDFA